MSSVVKIERKITLDSQYLTKDIKNHIFNKIKKLIENECTKDNGYFINLIKILRIKDNYISSNCENIFIVEFESENLKPEIGKIFEGNVCMIFSGGIFLNVKNKLKVLIPLTSIPDYEFNQPENVFIHKKNKKQIKESDILKVLITGTKYSKQNFSCFGNLIED